MSDASMFSEWGLFAILNSSWLQASDFLHLPYVYQVVLETPIPYGPFGITLWSILFWTICILVVVPRALGVVFSIVIFFVARIPGVRLTIAKISMIDGFQDIKFHYEVTEMSVSVSVDAIKLRPWFYAPALMSKPQKVLVGLVERPEIILCIKTGEHDGQSVARKRQQDVAPATPTQDGLLSKLIKLTMMLLEISVSKLSIKVTRDRKNELVVIDCLEISFLGNYTADIEAPVASPRRLPRIFNFRRSMKANSLFCPEILSKNFCCQFQHIQESELNRKPASSSRTADIKRPVVVPGTSPPPAPPPPPINSLWKLLTFSPWKPPLGINFEINRGHTKKDVYSMASELNQRKIPAAFSISSFSLCARSNSISQEKSSLKWDLNVAPVCFVCSLEHLKRLSFVAEASGKNVPTDSQPSSAASVRLFLESLHPVFPITCSFEKVVLCAAFDVSDGFVSEGTPKAPFSDNLDALQISFENPRIVCESTLIPVDNSGTSAVHGQASLNITFESVQGSYMSVFDTTLLDVNKLECNIKLILGQASVGSGQGAIFIEGRIARARAAGGVNGLANRRARKPSVDAGHAAFIASGPSSTDQHVTLDMQIACTEFVMMVTDALLLASAHFCRNALSLSHSNDAEAIPSTDAPPHAPSLFSHMFVKCQIETVGISFGDFSRQKDAMTELAWKSWTIRFSDEPGNFGNQIRNFVTETSELSVNFLIGRTPASTSHCLHDIYLENSDKLVCIKGCKLSSSSSYGNSIELKSIIVLLSEPVVFDLAFAMKAIFRSLKTYRKALSTVADCDDGTHGNIPKTPVRLEVKKLEVTLFYDCSSYAARIAESQVGVSSEDVWLCMFHVVCSDIYYERTYKTGKGTLSHHLSLGNVSSFYFSPKVQALQGLNRVSAELCLRKDMQVLNVLDFKKIKADVEHKLASSLIIASIHIAGANESNECVSLSLECVFALLSAGDTFTRLAGLCGIESAPQSSAGHVSSETGIGQPPSFPKVWFAFDCECMSFMFSATPRSNMQVSFASLSVRRRTGHGSSPDSLNELSVLDGEDDFTQAGPHAEFFEGIYEQKAFKDGSSTMFALVASEFRVNYLPCVVRDKVPHSSFRFGTDVAACETLLVAQTIALSLPSNPASEYSEDKMRSMLRQEIESNDASPDLPQCPPLDHITLQLINLVLSVSVSPTTTVSGRNILKQRPYGLVDFGMIMDDTLLAIKACQKVIDNEISTSSSSKSVSDVKTALCLYVRQAKLRVKEYRLEVGRDGEALVSGEGWLWAIHCLHQDELVERQKRWVEVEKMIKHQKTKKHSLDDKEWKEAFDSENATIWKERVKKMKEKLKQHPESKIIPDLCVISIHRVIIGFTNWSQGPLINSMMEKLDDSGAKRSVFQSEWPDFDDVYGGLIFGNISRLRMQLRAFEKPLVEFESYEWGGKVVIAEEHSNSDLFVPCSIIVKPSSPYRIIIRRSCLPMKLYHQTQATMSGFCLFYGSSHAQCISMMGAALSSLSPPSPAAVAPLLPFDKLRLMLHGSSEIRFVPASPDGSAIEVILSISNSPQAFGDAVQFLFDSVKLETSLAKLSLESRGVSFNFLYGEKLIWPLLSSYEMKVVVSFDWMCLGSSCKHHFNQIMNQVQADGGTLRSMMGKGDMCPTFRSAGVRLKLELDTVNTVLRLHVDSFNFIFRVLNSLDRVGNSFLQYKSFHSAEGCYFSLPERTKPFGQHILSIGIVFRAEPVSIFCFYSGQMPSRQTVRPVLRKKDPAVNEQHHGIFRFATKTFVFKLEQSHVLQPASKYNQRMAVLMESDDVPRKLEWVINTLELETKMLSIYDVGFHHNCNGWYGDGNALVVTASSGQYSVAKDVSNPEKFVNQHLKYLDYSCWCEQKCVLDGRPCDDHHIIATSQGVKLAAGAGRADGPQGSGQSQRSSHSQRSAGLSEDAVEGSVVRKLSGSDARDRTRQWVGGLAVGDAGVKASKSSSSSPVAVLSELLKKSLAAVIKSEDRYFIPPAFKALGPSSPKLRVVDARDMMLDILAESLFVQITYDNRYAYSVWSNGLRCAVRDEPVNRRSQDGYVQLSESEIKWRRFLDPSDEVIGSNTRSSDTRGKPAVPEQWQHCNEFQGSISRPVWRLKLKEPQLGIQALPPERQAKQFQCRLQHRLLLTGQTGEILSTAVRFFDQKENCWKSPRSHVILTMDGIMVRMSPDQSAEDGSPQSPDMNPEIQSSPTPTARRRKTVLNRSISIWRHAGIQFKDSPDESTYLLTKLWGDVVWVTGDKDRNAAQKVVLESPYLQYSFYCDLEAPNSVTDSRNSMKKDVHMHSPTHVDLTYGNVVCVLIKEVTATTDCVQAKVFFEVINGLLRPLPTETEADEMMEALRLNALLDVNEMQRIKKIEMDINHLKRQLEDPFASRLEGDRRAELAKLEAELRKLTRAGQEQLSEQRLRFLSYHILNCTWELRAKEQEIDAAFEKGVRCNSFGGPEDFSSFSKVKLDDIFGTVSYSSTEPLGFSFRVRSFVVHNKTMENPRLGEFVFQPKQVLTPSLGDDLAKADARVRNASYIAAAIQKFLGDEKESASTQNGSDLDESDVMQMLNIEIFKAPRVGAIDNYELLVLDVAAMKVCIPHEFFVLLYDFFFEAEKKAFLQPAFNDLHGDVARDSEAHSVEVMRFTKHESDVKCEENLQTKLEMKKRGTDNHFFKEGPNISWNFADINDLELSVNKIEFYDKNWTWSEMFDQFKDLVIKDLTQQAPKVARHKLSDLFSRKKTSVASRPPSSVEAMAFGGSASAPVTPMVVSRGGVPLPRSAGGGGVNR